MRRAARVDDNQEEIVRALRAVGVWVCVTSSMGAGFPDLLVWFRGRFVLMEVKDPTKPKADRQLTPAQKAFHARCPGPVHVVESAADAFRVLGLSVNPTGEVQGRQTP